MKTERKLFKMGELLVVSEVGAKEGSQTTGRINEYNPAKIFREGQDQNIFPTDSGTANVSINTINELDIINLQKKFSEELIGLIITEDFEYGRQSQTELLVKQQLDKNRVATKMWLNGIYLKNFNSPEILIGLLRIISRFGKDIFEPTGQTMALASLAHKNEEVVETAIRVFESWSDESSLEILENVHVKTPWLDEYRMAVIRDIKSELCLS